MKKYAIALATAALLSSAAQAATCASSFSGFYAGLQAGMGSTTGKVTEAVTVAAAGLTQGNKQSFGDKSFVGGLFAGYGMGVGGCSYVGAELYANFDSLKAMTEKRANGDQDAKFSSKYNMGAKVRLGYTVSPQAMIFLGLGGEFSKAKVKFKDTATTTRTNSKRNIVFAPSVGMEMFLSKNALVRGEFTYAVGQKVNMKNATGTVVAKAKANQQRFMLGLGYKF